MHIYSLLALGDSYTIGEAVPLHDSFPYQAVKILREKGFNFNAPEIIAKTGWTSDELKQAIRNYKFLPRYDFVSLLIGVNNQYRGLPVIEYKEEYEELLQKALQLANGKKDRVILVSIPDYSVMPFSASLDKEKISREIEVCNSIGKALSIQYKTHFIDVTAFSREAVKDSSLVASDGLHPSSAQYAKWSEKFVEPILKLLK